MDDRTRRSWMAVQSKFGGTPFQLAAALATDTPAADKLALENAAVLELRRNGAIFAVVADIHPHFAVPDQPVKGPVQAIFAWTPRCLATSVFDVLDAGGHRLPYAAIAYRSLKPLMWRNQGRGMGMGQLAGTRFEVTQCVGGMVVATLRAPTFDIAELDIALRALEEVSRLAWRGPSPSSFHDLMVQDNKPKSPVRYMVVAAALLAIVAVIAFGFMQSMAAK